MFMLLSWIADLRTEAVNLSTSKVLTRIMMQIRICMCVCVEQRLSDLSGHAAHLCVTHQA